MEFRIIYPLSVLLISAFCLSTGNATAENATSSSQVQLLRDASFARGFHLLGTRSIESGSKVMDVLDFGTTGSAAPAWRLAQWGTRHTLQGARVEVLKPGVFRYSNIAKAVTVDTTVGELTLKANASKEYAAPRKQNEEWPHLLVEQYFAHQPYLKDVRELRMKLKVKLSSFEDHMTSSTFDPGLHAAQLQIYLMVQNMDKSSSAHGDYLWFGIPLFDNRDNMPGETYHQDGGKEDTTHKFIYIMPAHELWQKGLRHADWATIDVDVLPWIRKAYQLAQRGGFLSSTPYEPLAVTSMNLGWELPGIYDVEAKVRELELWAVP